jgi:hypothetical protein
MTHRTLRRLPLVIILMIAAAALLHGCDSQDAPVYENPLDPRYPGSTDPFELTAVYANGWVTLEWVVPPGPAIAEIVIESLVAGQPSDLDTVAVDETSYIDTAPRANAENQYRLRAVDEFGRSAQNSHVVAATLFVPPVIDLPDGIRTADGVKIRSAYHDILVRAETGDVAQLDTLDDFSAARLAPVVDGEAVFPGYKILAERTDQGVVLPGRDLFARVGLINGTDTLWVSDVDVLPITIEFISTFGRVGGGRTVAAPNVDITLTSTGIGADSLRFATSRAGLNDAAWRLPAEEFLDVPLRDTPGSQPLFAQFRTEFGYDVIPDSVVFSGDPLTSAAFDLVLPESGIVEGRTVGVEPRAVATEMRFSTSLGFEDAPWQAYTDSLGVELRAEPGPQILYAQFRNHWFISAILSEEVLLSAAVLEPAFTAPLDGDPVRAGATIDVTGEVAEPDSGYALTRLEVHFGDGWQDLPPDTSWATTWTAPEGFTVDTPWRLGVRATAEDPNLGDTIQGVEWIEVLITQLTLAITEPAAGEEVTTGAPVTIRGTATSDLTGADLKAIVVDVADTTIVTTEALTGWSVTWNAAAVADTTDATITATVYAGQESLQRSVDVVLLPPEPDEEE